MHRLRHWAAKRLKREIDLAKRALKKVIRIASGNQIINTTYQTQSHEISELKQQLKYLNDKLKLIEHIACKNTYEDSASPEETLSTVSVIMPTFNRAFCLSEAIQSVISQENVNWELIIIDDGSNDNTQEILESYQNDPRIRVIQHKSNLGASIARNRGLELAHGDLIAYLDSDNLYFPGFLKSAKKALESNPEVDLVYGILASEANYHGGAKDARAFFFQRHERADLLDRNYIDLNTVMHRRFLISRFGGFDIDLDRLLDWDLMLRYTQEKPPLALPILASLYRTIAPERISTKQPHNPSHVLIQKRWRHRTIPDRTLRVLYAVWHYPQLSETYIEAEIQTMLRWGVDIQVWREDSSPSASPYPTSVPLHYGDITTVINSFQPDVIHCHWSSFCLRNAEILSKNSIPVTLRLHGFDVNKGVINKLQQLPWISRIYGFPKQIDLLGKSDDHFCKMHVGFDSSRFGPVHTKNRRLVIRTSAALPSKDIPMFLELANRLPEFQFIFAGVTCLHKEEIVDDIKKCHRKLRSRAELLFDVPHETIAELVAEAGIYLHTAHLQGDIHATPLGMPISIAEAMATGSYVLARRCPEFSYMLGDAGDLYADIDEAEYLIRKSVGWTNEEWLAVSNKALERAFGSFADEIVLKPMYDDWCRLQKVGLGK
jgi:glycosyltransferase involved in cell wall biosynthesis